MDMTDQEKIELLQEIVNEYRARTREVSRTAAQTPAHADEIVNALRAIIIRCDEGDKKSDWLPIISSLAKSVLPKAVALSCGAAQAPPNKD
jgi:hypothetical protein